MENEKMFSLLEKIYAEVQETKAEVKKANARIDGLELKVDKNTMPLERVNEHTKILAEVLQIDINTLTAKTAKTDTKVIQFERLLSSSDKKQG